MKRFLIPAVVLPLVLLASCQKVIDVNLNGSNPQYVVEGDVTDQPGPYTVRVSRSVNFSELNNFPAVTAAFITIKDLTSGATDTLREDTSGYYRTTHLQGFPGHQYDLYIKTGDHEFTASSTMPPPVEMDSVYTAHSFFDAKELFAVPAYTDPVTTGNRYLITQRVNNITVKDQDVHSDAITNGQPFRFPFYYDNGDDSGNPKIRVGDSVFITLRTIDNPVYEFYRTLQDTKSQNSAALSNPLTNIKGGAMGYFNAAASRTKGILVH